MSTISHDSLPTQSAKRKWPDMSAYGIHFGIVTMPNKESRLVMVDDEGSWAPLAKSMGFSQSRWFGLYVKSSTKLDIPGFKSNFPSATVLELTFDEIKERIKPLILARKNKRLSQMHAGRGRLSWHPTRTEVAEAAAAVVEPTAEVAESALSPEQALRQTLLLGMNYMGQDVFESGDGQRFVRTGDSIIAKETFDAAPDPVFLRARTDDDLTQVAAGMVREIIADKRLHSDDFIRFMDASQGVGSSEDKEAVGRFHIALDRAMRQHIESFEGASREMFDEALRLHEGRPTFWRAPGTMATPLPISVVMQSLAAARANASVDAAVPPVAIDITNTPKSHSWALSATSVSGGDIPVHDISLAGVFGRPVTPKSISGIRVTRSDTEQLLEALAKRRPDGLTVFTMTADVAGKLDNEFRRVLSAIGERYEVSGLTDVDAAMIGPGSTQCSRLVVVGHKRETPDYTFAVPGVIPVIYDYASLWNWGEAIRATQFGEIQSFGDDGRETNRWQAPYIPASQISEPVAMSPRNMLGPVRKALANLVERHGFGVDEYVCDKLGWTMEQLESALDAEQADAVALSIQAIDDGAAIVEGDATGLGKGRVAATLALYGKRKGMPVMFMTEKADLFSDFYRDVADVGGMDALKNPFVVNSDLVIRDVSTGKEIARTPKRDVASQTFACGEVPTSYDLVLSTYSQFNREYNPTRAAHNVDLSRTLKGVIAGELTPFQALSALRHRIGHVSYGSVGVVDEQGAIAYEQTQAALKKVTNQDALAKEHEDLAAALQSGAATAAYLSSLVKSDMTSLKHQWLYSGAMDGALLILDEAHVAAGETSRTGANLRYLKDRAGAIEYSSATFAKDTANFALYSRVFPSTLRVATIGETLERGGEPMQEILSAMLAEDGRLIRREHDLSNVDFRNSVDIEHRERNTMWSDALARVLSTMSFLSGEVDEIVTKMNEESEQAAKAAKKNNPNAAATPSVGLHYTNFGSKFYNLSRAFSMAMNADNAADLAIKALREGRKPVITVDNTMESVLRELIDGVQLDDEAEAEPTSAPAAKSKTSASASQSAMGMRNDPLAGLGGDDEASVLSGADPLAGLGEADADGTKKPRNKVGDTVDLGRTVSFKDILVTYIESMFVARRQTRSGGKVISSVRVDMMKPELQALLDEVRHYIDQMPDVPLSPLDLVRARVAAAGFSIDEISGRRLALQTNPDGTHSVVRMAERKKLTLKNDFNSGKLDALILSRSGSTGISLHASRTFADQSQRELIMLQLPADIVQMVQFIGRINRKGQVCNPVVTMACSGLPGELRLMMMHNSKLRKMSANVSGNADNASKNEAPDILNRVGNEVAFRWMEANPKEAKLVGFDIGEIDTAEATRNNTKFVDMLTSKIPMFLSHEQVRIYAELQTEFEALIQQYEMEGRNPLKAAEYDLRARRTASKSLQVASGHGSVFDAAVVASELTYEVKVPGLDPGEPKARAESSDYFLAQEHGANYAQVVAKNALDVMNASLPTRLSKRHTSVAAALAEDKPNDVKNTKAKFEWLAENLPKMRPGSIVALAGEEFAGQEDSVAARTDYYGIERVFITGWKLPDNPMQMAGYKLTGYSSLTRAKVELSLTSIQSRPAKWVLADFNNAKKTGPLKDSYDKEVAEFFNRAKADFKGEEKRVILEGNLFRAAEIAEANKQGAAVTYTDEKGVWRHAILMPRYCDIDSIDDLPITVDDAPSLTAAFAEHTSTFNMTVTDDFRRVNNVNKHTYRLLGSTKMLVCQVYDKCAWLVGNEAIQACLVNSSFTSNRTMAEGKVKPGSEEAFLTAFMAAATEAGVRVLLDGSKREWYNNYLNSRAETAVSQADIENALSGEDDELSSLLAAPAM